MTNNISEAAQIKIVQIIAKELGVGPHQVAAAVALLDEGSTVPDAQAALDGAREILCERFAETAELLAKLRARMWEQGIVTSTVMKGKETAEEEKFRDYYAYAEAIRTIPSHRALALFRGQSLAVLKIELGLGEEIEAAVPHPCVAMIAAHFGIEERGRRADKWLA